MPRHSALEANRSAPFNAINVRPPRALRPPLPPPNVPSTISTSLSMVVNQKHQESSAVKDNMPPPPNWTPKMYLDKNQHCNIFDKPLELTMNKNLHPNKSHLDLQQSADLESAAVKTSPLLPFSVGSAGGSELPQPEQMVLPPPPPLWYPPLYPPGNSYSSTFDPLHFFIDLRVSGHIYDRKTTAAKESENLETQFASPLGCFKQSRHCSAFSLPNNNSADGNFPMNLMTTPTSSGDVKTKFDVKSMGFDKTENASPNNKTSTNYIMQNIDGIYKGINSGASEESEKEDEKKKEKDLRALIGLELVVDYMSHGKKKVGVAPAEEGQGAEEVEGCGRGASPPVEVVAVGDNATYNKYD